MRFFHVGKDGGSKSTVTGYWLVELKNLFSIALLRFDNGSRSEYHSHAFNCLSWVLKGRLREQYLFESSVSEINEKTYRPSLWPIITLRSTFHKVVSDGTTWVLTIRGPWAKTWDEYSPNTREFTTLQHGRVPVATYS